LRRRVAIPAEHAAVAGKAIQDYVQRLPAFQNAEVVMAYVPIRNEVDTGGLIDAALAAGKHVAFPVTDTRRKEIYPRIVMRYPEDLVAGPFGINEPRPSCPVAAPEEIDLILVPGVAFDAKGFRLGYGEGYYDRFLPLTSGTSIGLAYSFQLVKTVFPEKHDWPVDFIVTEEITIETSAGANRRK
jgi:5-formyltetrahydrofolate cyclo-ligase